MEPRAAKFGLIGFGCSTITRLAREGGGLGGIWLEPSDTVLMVRRILSAEAGARPDELLGWFRQTQEPAGADWPDVERKQRLEYLLSLLGEWLRIVVCYCGRDDHFRVLTTDPLGGVRHWFACPSCRRRCRIVYGGARFRCRPCRGARYESQYERESLRVCDIRWRIRDRLKERWGTDCDLDSFPQKPPAEQRPKPIPHG